MARKISQCRRSDIQRRSSHACVRTNRADLVRQRTEPSIPTAKTLYGLTGQQPTSKSQGQPSVLSSLDANEGCSSDQRSFIPSSVEGDVKGLGDMGRPKIKRQRKQSLELIEQLFAEQPDGFELATGGPDAAQHLFPTRVPSNRVVRVNPRRRRPVRA